MTPEQRFERDLPELLTDLLAGPSPDYRDDIVRAAAGIRQRPRWAIPERWLPMQVEGLVRSQTPPLPWRALAVMALLVIAIVSALLVIGRPDVRLPPPFGVAGNGLIAFSAEDERSLLLADPTTGAIRTIATIGSKPLFSPDGTHLAYVAGNGIDPAHLIVASWDGTRASALEPALPEGPQGSLAWSADGRTLLYSHKANGSLYLYDSTGANPTEEMSRGDYITAGSFRPPDGRQLLVARSSDLGYDLLLVSKSGMGGGSRVLEVPGESATFVGSGGLGPWSWSPGGSRLAVSIPLGADGNGRRIVVVNADGTGAHELTTVDRPVIEELPQWSPDGTAILFWRLLMDREGAWIPDAWVVWPLDGGTPLEMQPTRDLNGPAALWSPDGRLLLITNEARDQWRIIQVEGGAERTIDIKGRGLPSWQRLALP